VNPPSVEVERQTDANIILKIGGNWIVGEAIPRSDSILLTLIDLMPFKQLAFDCQQLNRWDSLILATLTKLNLFCESHAIQFVPDGLPKGIRGLMTLARSVPDHHTVGHTVRSEGLLETIGRHTLNGIRDFNNLAEFVGDICLAFGRLILGRTNMRRSDLWSMIQECGPNALPIISLISTLVGMILGWGWHVKWAP
jgi:phospholipid/cholesterol/gamma-HCH transport system permease protein